MSLCHKKPLNIVVSSVIRSIKNDGNNEYLTVHNSMYIAGLPEETGEKALKLWHLRNATSFNGRDPGFDSSFA
jgi:hypothetical protein